MEPIDIVEGRVVSLPRSDIDTDQIVPKQFLKRVERTGYGEFLFYDWRKNGEVELAPGEILVAGENFGCGSSREHAVWAILDWGFKAVVAPSYSDIFTSNAYKNGLLLVQLSQEECSALSNVDLARIDLPDQTIVSSAGVFEFDFDLEHKEMLLLGADEIEDTLSRLEAIEEFEKRDPRSLEKGTQDIVVMQR